jgi:predicted signal transduction protein with EAL and GGDEF domain
MTLPQGLAQVGASVGISLFPACSEEAEELLRQADHAMYHSKHHGTNLYSFFSTELASEPD